MRKKLVVGIGLIGLLVGNAPPVGAQFGCPNCVESGGYVYCTEWAYGWSNCMGQFNYKEEWSWCMTWGETCDLTFHDTAPDGRIGFGSVVVAALPSNEVRPRGPFPFAAMLSELGLTARFTFGCGGRIVAREYDSLSAAAMRAQVKTIIL
jgi:hypothetical protein